MRTITAALATHPMPKIPAKADFVLIFIWRFQTRKMGRIPSTKSQQVAVTL
jgi:hypothetical protein